MTAFPVPLLPHRGDVTADARAYLANGIVAAKERCDLYYYMANTFLEEHKTKVGHAWLWSGLLCTAGQPLPDHASYATSTSSPPVELRPLDVSDVVGNVCNKHRCGHERLRASSRWDHDPVAVAGKAGFTSGVLSWA